VLQHVSIAEHKHMPEPVRRMEVFTGAGRRRSWSAAEAPRRVRRRAHVDGIELEIAGVEVRIGADAKPRSIEAVIRALKANS
jgi:hypothetical protein